MVFSYLSTSCSVCKSYHSSVCAHTIVWIIVRKCTSVDIILLSTLLCVALLERFCATRLMRFCATRLMAFSRSHITESRKSLGLMVFFSWASAASDSAASDSAASVCASENAVRASESAVRGSKRERSAREHVSEWEHSAGERSAHQRVSKRERSACERSKCAQTCQRVRAQRAQRVSKLECSAREHVSERARAPRCVSLAELKFKKSHVPCASSELLHNRPPFASWESRRSGLKRQL